MSTSDTNFIEVHLGLWVSHAAGQIYKTCPTEYSFHISWRNTKVFLWQNGSVCQWRQNRPWIFREAPSCTTYKCTNFSSVSWLDRRLQDAHSICATAAKQKQRSNLKSRKTRSHFLDATKFYLPRTNCRRLDHYPPRHFFVTMDCFVNYIH